MPRGGRKSKGPDAEAYRHGEAKRKNIPEAGLIEFEQKVRDGKKEYCWDPRESPQLVWAGKAGLKKVEVEERASLEIPIVNLHIHERVSTEAILRAARRMDAQRSLFADPEMEFKDEIRFYQHDVDWSNRMILGDSLLVMNSLLEREQMRGKVQMIYMDPPYGIRYSSNFQYRIDDPQMKDQDKDDYLSREVEVVQAFRDTWELGIHSYLAYIRDRLLLCHDLLADSGSIFVQIGDENVHRVRCLLDEVFGADCAVVEILIKKKGSQKSGVMDPVNDYLLWYGRSPRTSGALKFRPVFEKVQLDYEVLSANRYLEMPDGQVTDVTACEGADGEPLDYRFAPKRLAQDFAGGRLFASNPLTSGGERKNQSLPFEFQGRVYNPGAGACWKTTVRTDSGSTPGMVRLRTSNRLWATQNQLRFRRYLDDLGHTRLSNWWDGLGGAPDQDYVVQTNEEILTRCMLMTTDPGDLVLDPTCGSGTTAFVGEQWGRRWITMDTSRVALAVARHRLMAQGCFKWYRLRHQLSGVAGGLVYKSVPHVELNHIANNAEIDAIAAEYQPRIDTALGVANRAYGEQWKEWQVPRPDGDREQATGTAVKTNSLREFWRLKREMQTKIDASIQRNAPQEQLVDQPEVEKGIVRVSGPFTVEALPQVAEVSAEVEFDTIPTDEGDLEAAILTPAEDRAGVANASAYVGDMIEKLRKTGVFVKRSRKVEFETLRPLDHEIVHAEGEFSLPGLSTPETRDPKPDPDLAALAGKRVRCAVVFGPQNGSVGESLVRDATRAAAPYDAVLFCGYDFTGPAQEVINSDPIPGKRLLMAYICPTNSPGMQGLLKETKTTQNFTMVGEPDIVVYRQGDASLTALLDDARRRGVEDVLERAKRLADGEMFVELRGVDLYEPLTGEVTSDRGENVHAVFVDHDYDGKSFCICQALFPNKKDSWDKIARNLKGTIDEEAFEAMRTLVSLPFKPGTEGRVQVKVIDARGNAVVKTVKV